MTNVYLKLQHHSGSSRVVDVIPLKVNSVGVSVDKSIPSLPVPLSGLFTGESSTAALDLGMSNKRISLDGFIVETEMARSHTKSGGSATTLKFTAEETAQLIASGVDSTGLARYQAINELVVLIPSKVDETYAQRANDAEKNIALTFASRGNTLEKDNQFVALPKAFPLPEDHSDFAGHIGLTGFIQSFSFNLSAETTEVSFNLEFVVAAVIP